MIFSGRILWRLHEGYHDDVAVHNGLLYTTAEINHRDVVRVYMTKTWQQTSVIDIPCTRRGHRHTLCVNKHSILVACFMTDRIYRLSLDGKMIDIYNKDSNRRYKFNQPFACMSDCDDNLLVADQCKNRLQLLRGKQWSVLQLQPQPYWPSNAVYDGHALYVVQWHPDALVKYE